MKNPVGLAERREQPRLEDLLEALRRQPSGFERELEVVDLHLLDLGRRQRAGRRPRRVGLDVHRRRRRRGLLRRRGRGLGLGRGGAVIAVIAVIAAGERAKEPLL